MLETVVRPLGAETIIPDQWPVRPDRRCRRLPSFVLGDCECIVDILHRAFAELSGTARIGPIELATVISDTVDDDGARPLASGA